MNSEYDKTRSLMANFWPGAENNVAVRDLFRDRLEFLNQSNLREAIKNVRALYSSKTPELKWILAEYRKIKKSSDESFPSYQKEMNRIDDEHEKLIEVEERHRTFELELMTDEQLRSAIDAMGETNDWANGIMGKTAGRPSLWSRLARGLLWAYLSSQSTPSQSHNQGQRLSGSATE